MGAAAATWPQQLGDGGNVKELQAAWELPIPGAGLQLKLP